MNLSELTQQMRHTAEAIQQLASGLTPEQARWRPQAEAWSILEVINHLYDEEREDFRTRLDYILHRPGVAWPPINPQGWVAERGYNQRDLTASLSQFLAEREQSLAWLRGLPDPNWEQTEVTRFGSMRAGEMLAAWAAHDLLHLRQLVELRWALTVQATLPYSGAYAGEW